MKCGTTIAHRIVWDVIDTVNKELGLLQNLKQQTLVPKEKKQEKQPRPKTSHGHILLSCPWIETQTAKRRCHELRLVVAFLIHEEDPHNVPLKKNGEAYHKRYQKETLQQSKLVALVKLRSMSVPSNCKRSKHVPLQELPSWDKKPL